MKKLLQFISLSFFINLLSISPLWAGSQQTGEPIFSIEEVAQLAKKIEKTLAQKGTRVFLIARNGRPAGELPDGIEYTHVAFGVYSRIQIQAGETLPGYAFFNLYQNDNDQATSKLVTDYTIDFLANIHQLKVGIVIPKPELQKRLLKFIGTEKYQSLHNAKYSVVSNPNNAKFQNCTEYVLDVINAVIYQTVEQDQLKQVATDHFKAQEVQISPLKLLLGSMFIPAIAQSDHSGQIKTATYTTIANYMDEFGLAQQILSIEP